MFIKDKSIQKKISTVIMITTISALVLAVVTVFIFEVREFRLTIKRELTSIAAILGANLTAAIEFEDQNAGNQLLSALGNDPRVISGAVFTKGGETFASFKSNVEIPLEEYTPGLLSAFNPNVIEIDQPILHRDTVIGSIKILAVDRKMGSRLLEYSYILLLAVVLSSLAALLLSSFLRRFISDPIVHLAEVAHTISNTNDYTMRATKTSNDETGILIDQFNKMLERIGALNSQLEQRVEERTLELEYSQEKLRHSERLASIGTLAAGIAHEIRNPLNSIQLAAQYALKDKSNVDPSLKSIFDIIGSEAMRCANIIKNVLLFAKSEQTIKSAHDINEVIRKSVELSRAYSQENFLMEVELFEVPTYVIMNPTEIEQVILNLIHNAIEASNGTPIISIKAFKEGDKTVITVSDKGRGIAPELINHIFDPFFSTKRRHGNTGLGLSLSHGIIQEHKGTMTVQSTVGVGTTFRIEFPRVSI